MNYRDWFDEYYKKHREIVNRLLATGYDKHDIIEYFKWENLKEAEKDFCPLFEKKQKCHNTEELNCYFCGCLHYRFDDDAPKVKSYCHINAKNGKQVEFDGIVHQDCSDCLIPHKERMVNKFFDTDWAKIMSECKS